MIGRSTRNRIGDDGLVPSRTEGHLSCLFADDVECLFVSAKSKENGMPHLGFTRPLGKFYLA
jgi:hypothetical protein